MNTIYFSIMSIALIGGIGGILLFMYNTILDNRDRKKRYLIISAIGLIVFISLNLAEKKIYTNTYAGRESLMSKAELYLNEKLLDKNFKITGMNNEGTVDYSISDGNDEIKKELSYEQYWNAKLNKSDSDSFWFLPIFLK
ncbi:hypothetical protein ACSXAS_15270 (plasmid) [Clostridium perfringens]|uniref:hypothetical protein n=1 Tax=Clostridium perfringens TaxID=1502 RepID=UPI002247EDF8|nr:hypothetical protein [Clostridium perfringens]MCX0386737.1 hypothetical protein [Clostridium perfringens]